MSRLLPGPEFREWRRSLLPEFEFLLLLVAMFVNFEVKKKLEMKRHNKYAGAIDLYSYALLQKILVSFLYMSVKKYSLMEIICTNDFSNVKLFLFWLRG